MLFPPEATARLLEQVLITTLDPCLPAVSHAFRVFDEGSALTQSSSLCYSLDKYGTRRLWHDFTFYVPILATFFASLKKASGWRSNERNHLSKMLLIVEMTFFHGTE